MAQDIATLIVLAISSDLEGQVFRESLAIIAHMQTRHEDVDRFRPTPAWPRLRLIASFIEPHHAKLAKLRPRKRFSGAWVAPAHIPGIFGEDRLAVMLVDLVGEHVLVEVAKLILHEDRHIHIGGEFHRLVVQRLDAALAGHGEDEEFLLAVCVHRAEADRQHEILMLIGDLDGPQER